MPPKVNKIKKLKKQQEKERKAASKEKIPEEKTTKNKTSKTSKSILSEAKQENNIKIFFLSQKDNLRSPKLSARLRAFADEDRKSDHYYRTTFITTMMNELPVGMYGDFIQAYLDTDEEERAIYN